MREALEVICRSLTPSGWSSTIETDMCSLPYTSTLLVAAKAGAAKAPATARAIRDFFIAFS